MQRKAKVFLFYDGEAVSFLHRGGKTIAPITRITTYATLEEAIREMQIEPFTRINADVLPRARISIMTWSHIMRFDHWDQFLQFANRGAINLDLYEKGERHHILYKGKSWSSP